MQLDSENRWSESKQCKPLKMDKDAFTLLSKLVIFAVILQSKCEFVLSALDSCWEVRGRKIYDKFSSSHSTRMWKMHAKWAEQRDRATFSCSQPLHEWIRKFGEVSSELKVYAFLHEIPTIRTKWILYFINCVISWEFRWSWNSRRRRKVSTFLLFLLFNRVNLGIWQMSQVFILFSYPLKSETFLHFFLNSHFTIFTVFISLFDISKRFGIFLAKFLWKFAKF